jgi:hypothetical protein
VHQIQLVTTESAYQCLSSKSGRKSGCKSSPQLQNSCEDDDDDKDDGCSSVTGYTGPVYDASKLQVGASLMFTVRRPAPTSAGFTLAHLCDQNVLPQQTVRAHAHYMYWCMSIVPTQPVDSVMLIQYAPLDD